MLLVQGTNDSSIVSKRSMVERGYFEDDYIKYFSQKSSRRSPLINLGYCVRACVMNYTLKHFCNVLKGKQFQVFSLGAGFDTTYFRLFSVDENVKYFEVDLEEVVRNKSAIILQTPELTKLIGDKKVSDGSTGISSENYILFPQNLNNLQELDLKLKNLGLNFSLPTIIFSECAITYMDEAKCTDLISYLAGKFTESVMITYEQIQPNDGFGAVMMRHFDSIQNPLKSVLKYKTLMDRKDQYRTNGWSSSESFCVYDLFSTCLSSSEIKEKLSIEPFDEWEEWYLKCCHYCTTISLNGSVFNEAFQNLIEIHVDEFSGKPPREVLNWSFESCSIERFGHSCIEVDKDCYLLVGGFGLLSNGKHSRLNDLKLISPVGSKDVTLTSQTDCISVESCYHSCTPLSKSEFIIYGGRKSPTTPVNTDPCVVEMLFDSDSCWAKVRRLSLSGEKPCSRWRHTMIEMDGKLYLFGGRSTGLNVLGDLWMLDVNFGWLLLDDDKPKARFSHTCVSYSGHLVICGGLDSNFKPLSDLWMFNTRDQTWKEEKVVGLLPRFSHTAHLLSHLLILVGGVNCTHSQQPGVSIIDLKTLTCIEYSLPDSTPLMPILLHNHWSTVDKEAKEIIVLGGGGNCFSFGTSFNKNPIEISLTQFKDFNF